MSRYFWLSDEQWAVIEPLLPKVHTGPERVDDRRIISGILYRLREGCRWRAVPEVYGPCTTVFNRYNRWSKRGLWHGIFAGLVGGNDPPAVTMIDSTAVKAHRSSAGARRSPEKRGDQEQAIGRSRGGRTTKIHAIVDDEGRPHALLLTGGNVADITGASQLLAATEPSEELIADKAYDADHLRAFLQARGTLVVIPNKSNRVNLYPFDADKYKARNIIERSIGRIKDFRAIATRYDKTARNFLSGICLAAVIIWWIN